MDCIIFILADEFSTDPIPFTIPAGGSGPVEEITVRYYDDTKFEAQVEGFILLIMVNTSTTSPSVVRFDSGRLALFQIIDYEDSESISTLNKNLKIFNVQIIPCNFHLLAAFTLGFDVSQLDVTEFSDSDSMAILSMSTMNGSSTEIPIILELIVEDSSTATSGEG